MENLNVMTDKVIATIDTSGKTTDGIGKMIDVTTDGIDEMIDVTTDMTGARIVGTINVIGAMIGGSMGGMFGTMISERRIAFAHIASLSSDSGWLHRLNVVKYVPHRHRVPMFGLADIGDFAPDNTFGLMAVGKCPQSSGRFGSKDIGRWKEMNGCSTQGTGLHRSLPPRHLPRPNLKSSCRLRRLPGDQRSCRPNPAQGIFGFRETGLGVVNVTSGSRGIGRQLVPNGFGRRQIGTNTVRIGNTVRATGSAVKS
jgi:hypothetical protein